MLWKLNFIIISILNSITEFERKIKNKRNLWKWSLNELKRHLAIGMPCSEMAHTERKRENTHAKQYQGKAWATKAQQD
jgi:hypothetical protein